MNAAKITRESKSNLALAFVALGRERRQDITDLLCLLPGDRRYCRFDRTERSGKSPRPDRVAAVAPGKQSGRIRDRARKCAN